MQRFDEITMVKRNKDFLDAWSQIPTDMSKSIDRGGVSRQVVSADVASLLSGTDVSKDNDRSAWTIQFDFPDFDKIKKELAEKYKLTPAEEAQNKAVELGKKWGTNPNGKKVTPYRKALAANEEHARLLFDEKIDEDDGPFSHGGISTISLIEADLFNTISLSDFIKKCGTAKEFKDYLKEQDVKVEDFNEKDISLILDAWPDFFEGEDIPEIKDGDSESRIPYMPQLFTEFAMDAPSDAIAYIQPVLSNNAKGTITMDMSDKDAMTRMQSLLDADEEEQKPVKTKMSYKQQQRMRNKNPMWKPN